jgi:hypothetical protein
MTPGNVETLIMVIGTLAFSGMGLVGLKILVSAWVKRKELSAEGDGPKIMETIDAIRAEQDALRDQLGGEIAELHERVDFAERLLSKGSFEVPLKEPEH